MRSPASSTSPQAPSKPTSPASCESSAPETASRSPCGPTRPAASDAAKAQLGAGGGGLRGCEQPHRSREPLVELANPGLVQTAGGLDGEDRSAPPGVVDDQPVQPVQVWPKDGSDSGGITWPTSPVVSHTRWLTLPGSIATTSVDAGSASCSKPTTSSRPLRKRHRDAAAGTGQRLSAVVTGEAGQRLMGDLPPMPPRPSTHCWPLPITGTLGRL